MILLKATTDSTVLLYGFLGIIGLLLIFSIWYIVRVIIPERRIDKKRREAERASLHDPFSNAYFRKK